MEYTQNEKVEAFKRSLLSMNRLEVKTLLSQDSKTNSLIDSIEQLVVPSLESIGTLWESGNLSLSQVYMSGRICEELLDSILPPSDPSRINQPSVAIAVLDDYHLLGKRIVHSALRASGIELHDYGHMNIETLIHKVAKDDIKILLLSVLMLPSALNIKQFRILFEREHDPIKILVGGAPFRFDKELWMEVGADGTGANSSEAIALVKKTIEEIQ